MITNLSLVDAPGEEWKAIAGYEGLYDVSNLGRVKSLCRLSKCGNYTRQVKSKILKQHVHAQTKYTSLRLYKETGQKQVNVHRLVALAFIPLVEGKPEVNHKDSVRYNNAVDNLEWVSAQENITHATAKGMFSATSNPNRLWAAKINAEVASKIKSRLLARKNNSAISIASIALEFNVTKAIVSAIYSGRTWVDVLPESGNRYEQ